MTNSQRLTIRASEIRQRLNDISGLEGDALTDEVRAEETKLQTEYRDTETKLRASIASDPAPVETRHADSPEGRELRSLIGRADCGSIYVAALEHRATDGATRELQEHYGLASNQVPLGMLEHRAVTPGTGRRGVHSRRRSSRTCSRRPQPRFWGIDTPTVGTGEAVYRCSPRSWTFGTCSRTPAENADAVLTKRPGPSRLTCYSPRASRRLSSTREKIAHGSPAWMRPCARI